MLVKENKGPEKIEYKLQSKHQYCIILLITGCISFPNKKKSNTHHYIQDCPYRPEYPVRRIPRRSLYGLIPASDSGYGKKTAGESNGKWNCYGQYKLYYIIHTGKTNKKEYCLQRLKPILFIVCN